MAPVSDRTEPHDEAEELLPWYATGQLEAADRVLVERHLSSCAACREQLNVERRLIQEFRSVEPQMDAGWARLRSKLEPRHRERKHPANRAWSFVRHPAVAAIAAAQFAFLVLGAGLLLWLSRPTYHALGSPATATHTADVIVMFRADATVDDVRKALRAANASIVDGPTAADAYLLHVPERRRDQSLARLRADDDVQMAEPIDGAPQ
jgi:predicted anti-sigma-YlaC factor YlaD